MAKPNVREQLIAAGLERLHAAGFNACGVQDIAEAAGVPKGSFYNHFVSKEAFGVEVLERYWQAGGAARDVLSDTAVPPLERVERHFDGLAAAITADDFRGCLMGNLAAELADHSRLLRDRVAQIFAAWARAIEGCIRDAQRAGQTRAELDAAALASFLINAFEGAILRAKIDKDGTAFAQFKATVFPLLLR
jgi:TetR/AcrR family transcriptional repressor of nem operon